MCQETSYRESLGLWQPAKLWKLSTSQARLNSIPTRRNPSRRERVEEGKEYLEEDNVAQGEVVLLWSATLREHQKGDSDCQSLAQCGNATASPKGDAVQASSPYLPVLAQHLERIASGDEMVVLKEELGWINRVIVPTSLIGEVIEVAQQGPGTAQEYAKKILELLAHYYYWPGM